MNLYLAIVVGVYRHEILGVFATKIGAEITAKKFLESEREISIRM